MTDGVRHLYLHFPFCRRRCSYCALHASVGRSAEARERHVRALVRDVGRAFADGTLAPTLESLYFGGGTPALCDLSPLLDALGPHLDGSTETTVELHPEDVTDDRLARFAGQGVNRISLGVQALDDATLAHMRRGYTVADARTAFDAVRRRIPNAGIDLIVGYPRREGEKPAPDVSLAGWGLAHASVYSLIREEKSLLGRWLSRTPPSDGAARLEPAGDDETLDALARLAEHLAAIGLERYEISNYARPGMECRHNLAVWRGEDYAGFGDGAFGRVGLSRTEARGEQIVRETVSPEADEKERTLFRLRTREGLDARAHPEWWPTLARFTGEGLMKRPDPKDPVYVLTARGTEVCDSLLAELV
jgi:oxygen-independent coproporphyrinogen-3 oxidase